MITETFQLSVEGIPIAGELIVPDSGSAPYPVVVICHGIPAGRPSNGDPGYRPLAARLAAAGFLSVLFNFRGCGLSGGNFDLAGWCRDLTAVLNLLWERPDTDTRRLSLLGFSGGAAVSCAVAAKDSRPFAVALMACPAELSFLFKPEEREAIIARAREIGAIRDPDFPADPQQWLDDLHGVKAEAFVADISPRPLLIVHGTADEVVPVEHAQRLYQQAGEPKKIVLLDDVLHRLRQAPQALDVAVEWLCDINNKREV